MTSTRLAKSSTTLPRCGEVASDQIRSEFVAELFKKKRIEDRTLYLWPKPDYMSLFSAYVYTVRARGDSNPRSPA